MLIVGLDQKLLNILIINLKYIYVIEEKNLIFFRKFKSLKLDLNKIENIEKNLKKIKINNNKLLIINLASLKIDKLSINVSINEIRKTFNTNTFSFIKIIQFFFLI